MAQMIDTLKAAVEAEKAKLLAELSQAAEPRLSAIRKELDACNCSSRDLPDRMRPDRSRAALRPANLPGVHRLPLSCT